MRKNNFYPIIWIATLIFFFLKSEAQVTHLSNDNTGTPSTDFLGWDNSVSNHLSIKTTNAYDINCYTNYGTTATPRLTILGSGNAGWVGINSTSPQAVLHVDGINYSTGDMLRTVAANGTSSSWSMRTWNPGNTSQIEYGRMFNTNGTSDFFMQATSGGLQFNTNGSNLRMIILSGGKVGIGGITTPAKMLEVRDGSGGDQLRLSYDATYRTDFYTTAAGYLDINPSGTRTGLNLNSGSPTAVLDVNGATSTLDPLRLRDLNSGSQTDFFPSHPVSSRKPGA